MPNPYQRGYDDHNLAQGFDNIAKMFAPPTATEIYAGAKVQEARQKMQGIAAMYDLARSASMSPEDKTRFDRFNAATGSGNMSTGYYGVDTKATTDRRGQDVDASTKIFNNNADNKTRTDIAMLAPVAKDATRFVPPALADMYKTAPSQTGVIAAQPGETNYVPGPQGQAGAGPVLKGTPKLPTEAEAKGAVFSGLPQDVKDRSVAGEHPRQLGTYPTGPNSKGSAVFDPVSNRWLDAQTQQPIPTNVPVATASGGTTVNVGPDGVAAPDKGFAYVLNPDGSRKIGANGAPMQVPMEGTPEFAKDKKTKDAAAQEALNKGQYDAVASDDVGRALKIVREHPDLATGLGAQITSAVGGTPAHNLGAHLASIKANISLERLQALRDSSPTGAALGRVTNQEMGMLQSAYGSLEQSQDATQLEDNLKRYNNALADVLHGKDQGPARLPLAYQAPSADEAAAELARRRGGMKK